MRTSERPASPYVLSIDVLEVVADRVELLLVEALDPDAGRHALPAA